MGDRRLFFPRQRELGPKGRYGIAIIETPFATWTAVTGYINFDRFFHIDADATPSDQFNFLQHDAVEQVTQEIRLAGTHDLADWLVGGFYSWDGIDLHTDGRHQDLIPTETSVITVDQKTQAAGFEQRHAPVQKPLRLSEFVRPA